MNNLPTCKKCGQVHEWCQAHRKRKNTGGKLVPCNRRPKRGDKNCRAHNAKAEYQTGERNSQYKHGKRAKTHYLPGSVAERYNVLSKAQGSDNTYLLLRKEITTVQVRISQLEERVNSNSGADTWRELAGMQTKLKAAIRTADAALMSTTLKDVDELIKTGTNDYRAWDELFKTQRHLKLLVESERKRLIEDKLTLSVDEVANIFRMLVESLQEEIDDEQLLRRVRSRIFKAARDSNMI